MRGRESTTSVSVKKSDASAVSLINPQPKSPKSGLRALHHRPLLPYAKDGPGGDSLRRGPGLSLLIGGLSCRDFEADALGLTSASLTAAPVMLRTTSYYDYDDSDHADLADIDHRFRRPHRDPSPPPHPHCTTGRTRWSCSRRWGFRN